MRAALATIVLAVTSTARAQDARVARAELSDYVQRHYVPAHEDAGGIAVVFSGDLLRLSPPWQIDVQSGSGHGSFLRFVRLECAGDDVQVDEVVWEGRSLTRANVSGHVRRGRVRAANVAKLVETIRVLPTMRIELAHTRSADEPLSRGGSWFSSANCFVVLRVSGPDRTRILERTFCDYPTSDTQFDLLPLQRILGLLQGAVPAERLMPLVRGEFRESHFVSAFMENRRLMLEGGWWWVMEESVEALALFGRPEVVPVLDDLRKRPGLLPRQRRKIDLILESPDHWLTGAPKSPLE